MKNRDYAHNQVDKIEDLKELISYGAVHFKDREAFVYKVKGDVKRVTYARFKDDVDALGTAFYSIGLKDKHIAVLGENSYEWIVAYMAAVNGSNVAVPIDKEQTAGEIGRILKESGCSAIVYSESYADVIEEIKSGTGRLQFFINMNLPADKESGGMLSFSALMETGRKLLAQGDDAFLKNEIDKDRMAVIIYTSGTTGKSKGVMLSHANLAADTVGGLQNVKFGERSLLVLPLHHTFAFTGGVLILLHAGSSIFITSSLKNFMADVAFHKPNDILLVPMFIESMYKKVWEGARAKNKDKLLKTMTGVSNALLKVGIDLRRKLFHSVLENFGGCLGVVVTGGALMDPKYVKGFRAFGINILNGYGITECSPVVSVNRNNYYRDGSIGLVLPCCEVRIDSPDENGEGEILIRGAIAMKGYYNDPQATAAAFEGEWFKTGDIGRFDKDGFLYITGRIKNLIILSNGKNVSPEELEMLVMNIPYVKEVVCAAAKEDGKKGALITAEVFPDADYLEKHPLEDIAAELNRDIGELNKSLPAYKRIEAIKMRDREFEKTASKKIRRA